MGALLMFAMSVPKPNSGTRKNEDCFSFLQQGGIVTAGVFDGVGGAGKGDEAATTTAKTLQMIAQSFLGKEYSWDDQERILQLTASLAHKQIINQRSGALTTACYGMFSESSIRGAYRVSIANIGDSRAYLLDAENKLHKITKDDSLFPAFVDQIDEVEEDGDFEGKNNLYTAFTQRNTITEALGDKKRANPPLAIYERIMEQGESVLFTTDGIHDVLSNKQMMSVVNRCADGQFSTERLGLEILEEVKRQNEKRDNVRRKFDDATIVILHNSKE